MREKQGEEKTVKDENIRFEKRRGNTGRGERKDEKRGKRERGRRRKKYRGKQEGERKGGNRTVQRKERKERKEGDSAEEVQLCNQRERGREG